MIIDKALSREHLLSLDQMAMEQAIAEDEIHLEINNETRDTIIDVDVAPSLGMQDHIDLEKEKDEGKREPKLTFRRRSSFGSTMQAVRLDNEPDQYDKTFLEGTTGHPTSFKSKLRKAQQRDLFFEVHENGNGEFKRLSLRELFEYVLNCVAITAKIPILLQKATHGANTDNEKGRNENRNSSVRKKLNESLGASFLHNRDLRQLFSANTASEPTITVRKHVVLVNFDSIRSIVLVDRVIMQVQAGADSELHEIEKEILGEHEEKMCFEFKAYEALLSVSSVTLARELKATEPKVKHIVNLMELPGGHAATSASANDKFRSLMNMVSEMDSRVKARRRALIQLLEDDEDLSLMNLTKMKENPQNYTLPLTPEVEEDHEEIELMLESFLQEINSLSNVLEGMSTRLRNVEALIQVKLDIARNRLLTASTIFSLVATCLGFGAVVSGMFGMNLNNNHTESNAWFIGITVSISVVALFSGSAVYFYLSRKGVWVS